MAEQPHAKRLNAGFILSAAEHRQRAARLRQIDLAESLEENLDRHARARDHEIIAREIERLLAGKD